MAIFGDLSLEAIVQVSDKTRLDATGSFISKDEAAITLIEIEPEAAAGFIDITSTKSRDWFLDWAYTTDGTKTVSLRITTDGGPVTFTKDIVVVTEVDDALFSSDSDIYNHEHRNNLAKFIEPGRNSFIKVHRRAQQMILDFMDEQGIRDSSGNRVTKALITDKEQVRAWSTFLTLRLIFQDATNSPDDEHAIKSIEYKKEELSARKRSVLLFDENGDGSITDGEGAQMLSMDLIRR